MGFARLEGKVGRLGTQGRFYRLLAVCLMAIVIFPSISDSDDLFRFSFLQAPSQTGGFGTAPQDERQEKNNFQLQRLLEDLEHFQIGALCLFSLTLLFLAFTLAPRLRSLSRAAECYAGRAPPLRPALL